MCLSLTPLLAASPSAKENHTHFFLAKQASETCCPGELCMRPPSDQAFSDVMLEPITNDDQPSHQGAELSRMTQVYLFCRSLPVAY
jgi:hypothetical protein